MVSGVCGQGAASKDRQSPLIQGIRLLESVLRRENRSERGDTPDGVDVIRSQRLVLFTIIACQYDVTLMYDIVQPY